MRKRGFKFAYVYIPLVLAFIYVPMACVVVYSFNDSKSALTWAGFTLRWYGAMLKDRALINSLIVSLQVAAFSCIISMTIGTAGAVAMERAAGRLKTAVSLLLYVPLVLPEVVLAVALLMFFSAGGVPFGKLTLVLSHTAFCVPYIYILVAVRLKGVDPALAEAARDLGARPVQAARDVTLPLIMPAVISGGLLAFAMSLDDVAISMFVSGPRAATMPVKVYSMLKLGVTPEVNALSTLVLAATFVAVGASQALARRKS